MIKYFLIKHLYMTILLAFYLLTHTVVLVLADCLCNLDSKLFCYEKYGT
jgi:hypothetical protein